MMSILNAQTSEFLKDQESKLKKEKMKWDNLKTEKEKENDNDKRLIETRKNNKKVKTSEYEKQ